MDDESVISIDSLFSSCKKKNKKTYFNNDDENEDVAEICKFNLFHFIINKYTLVLATIIQGVKKNLLNAKQ